MRLINKVCIDPGHGGVHPGAVYFGVKEKDLTLKLSLDLKKKLEASGLSVVMTRETDKDISLTDRCVISNKARCDLFISIHCNASYSPRACGFEVYRYGGKSDVSNTSKLVADSIQASVISKKKKKNGGVRTNTKFTTLRKTVATSLVIECGYLSNIAECGRLCDSIYQSLIVAGISDGISRANS